MRNAIQYQEHFPEDAYIFSAPCALGIDEAGRGPVMGPMVYSAAYWPLSEHEEIEKANYDDSKSLAEETREEMFEGIRADPRIGYTICTLSAECIWRAFKESH